MTTLYGDATLPGYILGITQRVREERSIQLIGRWSAPGCAIHTLAGPVRGAEAVVHGTLETLHAFPDRELLAEDVIWSDGGPGRDPLSSHRLLSSMTHVGDGLFGPSIGRLLATCTVAGCLVRIATGWRARMRAISHSARRAGRRCW
jgi:hypothetical protein